MIAMLFSVAFAAATADADSKAADAPKRYTPEIRGQLLDGAKPVTSNVCLRQSGSQIRMCGYTDATGTFYIPTHSARPLPGDDSAPTFWLEIGRVTEAKKIAPIEASEDKRATIMLACDLARSSSQPGPASICSRKTVPDSVAARVSKGESVRTHPASPEK